MPLQQALTAIDDSFEHEEAANQMNLFDF